MNALAMKETKGGIYYGLRCPCGSHRTRRFAFHVYICETCDQSFTVAQALEALAKKESKCEN